jgi:hypothetical protein
MKIAGIDVHKKVLMVVIVDGSAPEEKPTRRRFATMPSQLHQLLIWLQGQRVEEAVMDFYPASSARNASEHSVIGLFWSPSGVVACARAAGVLSNKGGRPQIPGVEKRPLLLAWRRLF